MFCNKKTRIVEASDEGFLRSKKNTATTFIFHLQISTSKHHFEQKTFSTKHQSFTKPIAQIPDWAPTTESEFGVKRKRLADSDLFTNLLLSSLLTRRKIVKLNTKTLRVYNNTKKNSDVVVWRQDLNLSAHENERTERKKNRSWKQKSSSKTFGCGGGGCVGKGRWKEKRLPWRS